MSGDVPGYPAPRMEEGILMNATSGKTFLILIKALGGTNKIGECKPGRSFFLNSFFKI